MPDGLQDLLPAELKSSNRLPVWVISAVVPFPIPAVAAASPTVTATSPASRHMVRIPA